MKKTEKTTRGVVLWTILLFLFADEVRAAGADRAGWMAGSVSWRLNERWELATGLEYRSKDDFSTTDRWSWNLAAGYSLTRWLEAEAGYELLIKHSDTRWPVEHRYWFSLTESVEVGRVEFSLRERFQHTLGSEHEYRLRTRFQAKVEATDRLSPYLWVEMYNDLGRGGHFSLARVRYRGGCEYRWTNTFSTDGFYLYQSQPGARRHVVGLEANFSF